MEYELSKREKKIARACIDKGLDAEFREGLENFEAIIRQWREGKLGNNKTAYHELTRAVDKKDKDLSRRYDSLSGSRWLATVAALLHEGCISEEDIKDFSDETKTVISNLRGFWRC